MDSERGTHRRVSPQRSHAVAESFCSAGDTACFAPGSAKLVELAGSVEGGSEDSDTPTMEVLERHLLVLEDQLFAALQAFTPAEKLVEYREHSARELAPYRSRLQTTQIRQIEQQFLRRCLFEQYKCLG